MIYKTIKWTKTICFKKFHLSGSHDVWKRTSYEYKYLKYVRFVAQLNQEQADILFIATKFKC